MLHGMSAGACVQLVMLPTDLIVTRLMATGSDRGYFHTLFHIIETDGLASLWSGIRPGLALTVNPGLTTTVRNQLTSSFTPPSTALRNFIIGMVSKATASTVTYPYTLMKVQIQVDGMQRVGGEEELAEGVKTGANKRNKRQLTMTEVFKRVVREEGLGGLWRGLAPQLTNAVLKEALLNMVRLEIVTLVDRVFDLL